MNVRKPRDRIGRGAFLLGSTFKNPRSLAASGNVNQAQRGKPGSEEAGLRRHEDEVVDPASVLSACAKSILTVEPGEGVRAGFRDLIGDAGPVHVIVDACHIAA